MFLNFRQMYKIVFLVAGSVCFASSCKLQSLETGGTHCSQYQYSQEKKTWINQYGQPVSCSIADNVRIFDYQPGEGEEAGCGLWKKLFNLDETIRFNEVPVRIGLADQSVTRTYCVLERSVELDNNGQVLLIADSYCLQPYELNSKEFFFISCENIYKKPVPPDKN